MIRVCGLVLFFLVYGNILLGQDINCESGVLADFSRFNKSDYLGVFYFTNNKLCKEKEVISIIDESVISINQDMCLDIYVLTYRGVSTKSEGWMNNSLDSNTRDLPGPVTYPDFLPVEMLRMYYISAIYYGDFSFRTHVKLGTEMNSCVKGIKPNVTEEGIYAIKNRQYKRNKRILLKADKSIDKWIELMNEHGLEYLRKNDISPLSFTKVKWL